MTLGLSLNRRKCEYYTESKLNHDEFENFAERKKDELTLLGFPLFKGELWAMLATSAYLASAASTVLLMGTILDAEE